MIGTLRTLITDHPWTYALPAGLGSAAYVLNNASQTGPLDFTIVLWAGLLGGLLTPDGSTMARRVGFRTGLVASLPLAWDIVSLAELIPTFNQPAWAGVLQAIMLLAAVALGVLFVSVGGAVGAAVGNWLSRKAGSEPASHPVQS
jgi:hypothetical protein